MRRLCPENVLTPVKGYIWMLSNIVSQFQQLLLHLQVMSLMVDLHQQD